LRGALRVKAKGEVPTRRPWGEKCVSKVAVRGSCRQLNEITVVDDLGRPILVAIQGDLRSLRQGHIPTEPKEGLLLRQD